MVAMNKPFRFGSRDNNPRKRPGAKSSSILGKYSDIARLYDFRSVFEEVEEVEREVREQVQRSGSIGTVELFDVGYKND